MTTVGLYRTPAAAPLGVRGRLALGVEILLDYVPSWRALRTDDLPRMVTESRAVRRVAPASRANEHELAVRLGAVVGRMLALMPTDSRCLIRSLVLTRMLARRAIPSEVVIGVRPGGPGFAAHAWVEHDGRAVLPNGSFDRLLSL